MAYFSLKSMYPDRSRRRVEKKQLTPAGKRSLERRQTLYDLISQLSSTLNYQKVLETSLDLGSIALAEIGAPVEKLASAVLLFIDEPSKPPEMRIATARHLLNSDRTIMLAGVRGLLAQVIENGAACEIKEPKNDPELGRLIALHATRSAYALPLRTGLDTYGVLLFAHPDSDFFLPERCEVLGIICNQSTIAIQNARLYQELEKEKNRMMEIQEESRKKLARDLHDGPTQSISAIAMRINFTRRLMDRDAKLAADELFKIEDLARKTTKEIRHMLFTLRPLVLESKGLIAALELMAQKMQETYDQNVVVRADPQVVEQLGAGKAGVIFYIIEEAVANARKHASAKHIWVRLKLLHDGVCFLEIEDDGIGFDSRLVDAGYDSRGSLGMINLKERTGLINGILNIDLTVGRGTSVKVLIPLNDEAADRIHRRG